MRSLHINWASLTPFRDPVMALDLEERDAGIDQGKLAFTHRYRWMQSNHIGQFQHCSVIIGGWKCTKPCTCKRVEKSSSSTPTGRRGLNTCVHSTSKTFSFVKGVNNLCAYGRATSDAGTLRISSCSRARMGGSPRPCSPPGRCCTSGWSLSLAGKLA